MSTGAYEYKIDLQPIEILNLVFFQKFYLKSVQGSLEDENTFTDGSLTLYATPLYGLSVTQNSIQQPVDINLGSSGTIYLTGMMTQIFGPGGPTTNYGSESLTTWYPNPVTQYPENFAAPEFYNSTPGPSLAQYILSQSQNLFSVWSFYLQPVAPSSPYQSFPILSFYTSCTSACASNLSTNNSDPTLWTTMGVMDLPEGYPTPPCNQPNGPIGQYVGFPFVTKTCEAADTFSLGYVNLVFVVPSYTNSAISLQVFSSSSAQNQSNVSFPGYLLAFYQRVPDPTCGDASLKFPLPTDSFPVVYDAVNLNNQSSYGNNSLLSWLNTALSTSYTTLNDLLTGENWLEGVTQSYSDGGTQSQGITLGNDLGDEWFYAGYVPYNLLQGTILTPTRWSSSQQSYSGVAFCSGNIVLGTVLNQNPTGNIFWNNL